MNYKKVRNVIPVIHKKGQLIILELEGNVRYVTLTPGQIRQFTGIEVYEVEILVNSCVAIDFYKKKDTMDNGSICGVNNRYVKNIILETDNSIQNSRAMLSPNLIKYKRINEVFTFKRNEREVIGFDIEDGKKVFLSINELSRYVKLNSEEIHLLEGSYVSPVYFEKGENLYEGLEHEPELCRKSGVIVRNLNLRLWGSYEEIQKKYESLNSKNNTTTYYEPNYGEEQEYNHGDWLEDAAGSNDPELMNAVYWNLD